MIEIKCFEVVQPIGTFYVGKMGWKDLLTISYSDIRRIKDEGTGIVEGYLGIQRSLSDGRLKEIAKYVGIEDATFPTSIVLSIKSVNSSTGEKNIISFDDNKGVLQLKEESNIAQIIDGQHRIFGIQKYCEEHNSLFKESFVFDLPVTLFIDMDPDDEAMVFSTINKAQTKVNKSLVYDLYDLAKTRSPQRTAHEIVKLLDDKDGSPLMGMVKRLGPANDPEFETITQATLVESILNYISAPGQEILDRDVLKRGKKLDLISGKQLERRFFRNWFIQEKDAYIAKVIWNYFSAVKRRWPTAWSNKSILVKSTGVIAFFKFLHPIVNQLGIERLISEEEFFNVLSRITLTDDDFTTEKYKPGQGGISALFEDLKSQSGLKNG